jgi:hypothetical protein
MLKLFVKLFLILAGLLFGLFCLVLANHGAIRLYGWSQTGRLAPPQYPRIARYDVISFGADPLRAALEISGNAFLVVIAVLGFVAVILMFRRGLAWMQHWPDVLPLTLLAVFWATASATMVGHTDWIIPTSVLLAALATGIGWMSLRQMGLPISSRVSDVAAVSQRNAFANPQKRSRGMQIAMTAGIILLAIMKLAAVFGS